MSMVPLRGSIRDSVQKKGSLMQSSSILKQTPNAVGSPPPPSIGSQTTFPDMHAARYSIVLTKKPSTWSLTNTGRVSKYFLFAFNIILLLTGAAIFGLGIWMQVSKDVASFQQALDSKQPSHKYFTIASSLLLSFGILVIAVSIFGAWGICAERSPILSVYVVMLVVVYVTKLALLIVAVVFRVQLVGKLKNEVVKNFNDDEYNPNNNFAEDWDVVQLKLDCCGVYNYTDYWQITTWKRPEQSVPTSCCVTVGGNDKDKDQPKNYTQCQEEAGEHNTTLNSHFKYLKLNGCFDALLSIVNKNLTFIITVICSISFVELMGIVLSCCVCYARRKKPGEMSVTYSQTRKQQNHDCKIKKMQSK